MKHILENIKRHPYANLCILIVLTGLILYSKFIFGDYIFAYGDWGSDTKHSYLPAFEYYAQKIADFRLGNYDFSFGLGTSVFANISFLTDPFCAVVILMGILFGANNIGYFLIFMHMMKNVALGLVGMYYLKMFKFSDRTCIMASYVLSFCGYIMITGQHYQFASYAVIFMFTAVMCEKTLRDSKYWLGFLIGIILQGIVSPYSLFQQLIGIGVYSFIRVIQIYKGSEFKQAMKAFAGLIGVMLLGIMVSMFAFLPQCYEILKVSQRISGEESLFEMIKKSFGLLPKEYIQTGFLRLFSNNLQGLINTWEGPSVYFSTTPYYFSLFFPFCVTQSAVNIFDKTRSRKDRVMRVVIMGLMLFIFLFSFFPMLSNMFAYIAHRFVFVLLPVFLFCFAETMEDLICEKKYNCIVGIGTAVVSIVMLMILVKTQNEYSIACLKETIAVLVLIAVSLILIKFIRNVTVNKIMCGVLFGCIAFSIYYDSFIALYTERTIVSKEDYASRYHMPYFEEFSSIIDTDQDNFVRVDRTFLGYDGSPDIMYSFIYPMRSTSVYNSTLSKYTIEGIEKIAGNVAYTQIAYSLNSFGTCFDLHIADLLGLKYVVSYLGNMHPGWDIVSEYEGYYLYENKNLDSAGLLYDAYVTEKQFEQMDDASKASVTSQAVILNHEIDDNEKKTSMEYEIVVGGCELMEITEGQQVAICADMSIENSYFLRITGNGEGKIELKNENEEVLNSWYIDVNGKEDGEVIPLSSEIKSVVLTGNEMKISTAELLVSSHQYSKGVKSSNVNMGNVVEANVTLSESKILYMPIAYDTNWRAYVNGEEVEVLKANYGFVAVAVPAGDNNIKFVYRNDAFYIGLVISCIGLVIVSGIVWSQKERGKKR